ncbi:hypothetical protein SUGI_0199830 [Cryptomeria japonica]|nr:hypothetical protein SUGI_0199830 [Cryptomeria japonica]
MRSEVLGNVSEEQGKIYSKQFFLQHPHFFGRMRSEVCGVKNEEKKRANLNGGGNRASLGVSCSSPGDGKCLDPNAPEFTPPSILYSQRIFSPPVSSHNIYGQISVVHLSSEMQQQQKPLWHLSPAQDSFDNGGVHHLSYNTSLTPRTCYRDSATFYMFDENSAELYEGTPRTTLMVRNIPNKYSQSELIKLLDEHCLQQNSQKSGSNEVESAYDFVYLPIDFKNRCNLGYGFVNFTSVKGALRFYKARHLKMWERFNSNKICEISYARLQGKAALEEHFLNSTFPCNTEKYLPVKFSPPRNGIQCTPPTVAAGHLSGKRSFRCNSTPLSNSSNVVMNAIEKNSKSCENGATNDINSNVSSPDGANVPTN